MSDRVEEIRTLLDRLPKGLACDWEDTNHVEEGIEFDSGELTNLERAVVEAAVEREAAHDRYVAYVETAHTTGITQSPEYNSAPLHWAAIKADAKLAKAVAALLAARKEMCDAES